MKKLFNYMCAFIFFYATYSIADERIPIPLAAVKASSTYSTDHPFKAVDNNYGTWWNSGKLGTNDLGRFGTGGTWIQIDLGKITPISTIKLTPQQTPNGNTVHKIYVGSTSESMELIRTVNSYTSTGVTFEVPIVASGRYIKILTTSSPSWVAWQEIEVFKAENWVKYYGYYCSACFWVGNGNYISATSGHSNIAYITAIDPLLIEKINEAKIYNMHVMLDVSSIFLRDAKYLRIDYASAWNQLVNKLGSEINSVVTLYMVDEPNIRGVSKSTMQTSINTVKATYPHIPVSAIFSLEGNGFSGIELFDWVGLDCYDNGSGSCGVFTGFRGAEGKYYSFRSMLDTSRQKIMLIPQAGVPVDSANNTTISKNLPNQAEQYYQLAATDPVIVAMIPFIWQTFDDGSANWYGAEQFPELRNKFTDIGRRITGK